MVRYAYALTVENGPLVGEAYMYGLGTCRGGEVILQEIVKICSDTLSSLSPTLIPVKRYHVQPSMYIRQIAV